MIVTNVTYRCGHTIRHETEKISADNERLVRLLEGLNCPNCEPQDPAFALADDRHRIMWGAHSFLGDRHSL